MLTKTTNSWWFVQLHKLRNHVFPVMEYCRHKDLGHTTKSLSENQAQEYICFSVCKKNAWH